MPHACCSYMSFAKRSAVARSASRLVSGGSSSISSAVARSTLYPFDDATCYIVNSRWDFCEVYINKKHLPIQSFHGASASTSYYCSMYYTSCT